MNPKSLTNAAVIRFIPAGILILPEGYGAVSFFLPMFPADLVSHLISHPEIDLSRISFRVM